MRQPVFTGEERHFGGFSAEELELPAFSTFFFFFLVSHLAELRFSFLKLVLVQCTFMGFFCIVSFFSGADSASTAAVGGRPAVKD